MRKTQVWETPPDKSLLSVPDDDTRSNDVRLVPIRGLNLLAACFPTGIIHLLNTHGVNFTIRSSFTRHNQHVHALALCEHESLIISGGVSRCLPPTTHILIANHSLQQCRDMYLWDPYSPNTHDKLTGLRTGLCSIVVMSPRPSTSTGSLAVTLSLDSCVCVWSVRQKALLTCLFPSCFTFSLLSCILPADLAAAPPCTHGINIFGDFMLPAHKSRIILASNRVVVLTPRPAALSIEAPNISLLLASSNTNCIGVTQEGVLFLLDAPSSCCTAPKSSASLPSTSRYDLSSAGRRCLPVTARDGHHNMRVTTACLIDDSGTGNISQGRQASFISQTAVLFFAPPPILPMAPIDLRVGTGSEGRTLVQRSAGCLQAHSVENGRLLHVFEGCTDDISCVAVTSGDRKIGRFVLAGNDQEGGGATLFVWSLSPHGGLERSEQQVPLMISVQAHKVYPSCGAITCITGRATDVIVAFAGGKISMFSLVSRSFK